MLPLLKLDMHEESLFFALECFAETRAHNHQIRRPQPGRKWPIITIGIKIGVMNSIIEYIKSQKCAFSFLIAMQ